MGDVEPFMHNGTYHSHQLEESISVLRVVGLYFSYVFKFK